MKKTLLAIAILASGTASAAINVHTSENVSVDVSGAVEVQAFQSRFNVKNDKAYNEDVKGRLDDGDLQIDISAPINDDLKGIASTGWKYESNAVENDLLFVGLQSASFGTLTAGRQATIVDGSGISNDIEFGLGLYDSDGDNQSVFLVTSGDEVLKYKFEKDGYWAGISYYQNNDASEKNEENAFDLGAGATFADLTVAAYYQNASAKEAGKKGSQKAYQLDASYKLDALTLGASYADSDLKIGSTKASLDVAKLTAAYTIEKTTFALGADQGHVKANGQKVKLNNYYANVTYKFTDNVKAYSEVGYLNSDKLEKALKAEGAKLKLGYVVGLEVKF
ncbi:hypothetical protein SE23_07205 [Vibrio sinaloensis]|uniref:porin n=1 Tax=Photobacterium sp. (strain ATCC 43367) TaxID=379097 RepID=UPI00057E44EF|nr:porin [Vibrio sinaloensis]KIE21986.1 hypothetical protein SE23_07205 [Vibrio sinaloensis]